MHLSEAHVQTVKDLAAEVMLRRGPHAPVPPRLRELLTYMSARGPQFNNDAEELNQNDNDLIDTTTAAQYLDCTPRHICRIAADLDGIKRGRDWMFHRSTVIEYAEERKVQCPTRHSAAS